VISDSAWLQDGFLTTVGKRGAAIIEARGASSAFSAANALIDHVRALVTVGPTVHSIAVMSRGEYGFASGIWAGMPVRTTAPGTYEVVTSRTHDDFARGKIAATNAELVGERDLVKELLAAKA
jgi:malate dehydrogenase